MLSERYIPPPNRNQGLLEPELACLSLTDSKLNNCQASISCAVSSLSNTTCWNCKRYGHTHRDCKASKTLYCYRCGATGNYSSSCSKCHSKNAKGGVEPITTSVSPVSPRVGTAPQLTQNEAVKTKPSSVQSNRASRPLPAIRPATYVPHRDGRDVRNVEDDSVGKK